MSKYDDLLKEIEEITYADKLKDFHAFVYWFIEVNLGLEKEKILNSICDGTHDKGVDAVIIDDIERKVIVIQSKFEHKGNKVQIPESEIKLFTTVSKYFESKKALQAATLSANTVARNLLFQAFDKIKINNYSLELIFISTHKKALHLDKMIQETYQFQKGEFRIYDYTQIMRLYEDKIRDSTPGLGKYTLPFKDDDKALIRTSGFKSWVVSVPLEEIQQMVWKYEDKLVRKNVRNFLGASRCNKGIRETLKNDPEKFWYFNNGITILCDDANIVMEEKYIHIENPQIVNGCQTALSIGKFREDLKGDVMVRIIMASEHHDFVDHMILYQNSSNPVNKRDLKSNDPVQVRLRREFKLQNWYYEVKRGESYHNVIKKYPAFKQYKDRVLNNEKVAKILAAIKLGPYVAVSKGSDVFFDDSYDDLFFSKLSTFNCLAPTFLFRMIKDTYKGAGLFHQFKSHVFKNPGSFYVLYFIYQVSKTNDFFEKKFAAFYEHQDSGYQKFSIKYSKLIKEYFDIIYKAFKASGESDHNTFSKDQQH